MGLVPEKKKGLAKAMLIRKKTVSEGQKRRAHLNARTRPGTPQCIE